MISAGDFRNGKTFEMDGQVFQVVEFQHVKPGKGTISLDTIHLKVLAKDIFYLVGFGCICRKMRTVFN